MSDASVKPSKVNEVILVSGMTCMPKVGKTMKSIFSHIPSKGVNPDEAVAGPAFQGGLLTGNVTDILLLDVTPLSLIFSATADGQTAIKVKIFQGECELVRDNKPLGNFNLVGIPPTPKGVPQIGITFGIDADGIVHINAKDKATGKDQLMTIASSSGLSDKDIERMVANAEKYADADKACWELIEEANKGESVCIDTDKKAMNELKDQLDAAKKVSKLVGELHELASKGLVGDTCLYPPPCPGGLIPGIKGETSRSPSLMLSTT
ncbi:heat shock protein 70 family [Pisolithus sp. B1]|nr:heat shock protein 70 family [Pisolithus sp. B1]